MKSSKIIALALASGMLMTSVTACKKNNNTSEGTSGVLSSSAAASETLESIRISEDITASVVTEESVETVTFSGEDQKYANTFITNFAEQYFNVYPDNGPFDVTNASVEQVLTFAYFHIKINSYRDFEPGKKGECNYDTFTFEKASQVIGKYMSYFLKEEACKNLPAPPESIDNIGFGPYYADGKVWFSSGDGDTYRDIGIVDYAVYNSDGTVTLYFTVYNIDFDVFNSLDVDGVKKYYTLSPSEAANDTTLKRRGTGIANVDIGQSGKYSLRTYDVTLE